MLSERLLQVEERIQNAASRAGRKREEITLIAVTKKFPAEVTREAYELGLRCFGENYVQEFEAQAPVASRLGGRRISLDRTPSVEQSTHRRGIVSLDRNR